MTDLDEWMWATARQQHTVLALSQIREHGATRNQIRQRIERGEWERLSPNVIGLTGGPRTPMRALKALTLDGGPGTVISGHAAGGLWRLPGVDRDILEARRLRGTSCRAVQLGSVRQTRLLPEHHVTTVSGIDVLTLPRTIFDLSPSLHAGHVARLVDTVTGRSPSVLGLLHRMLDELAASGRNGITVMREILSDRPVGYLPPASNVERRFEKILADAGEPPMRRQVNLGGQEWIGRVDYTDDPPLFVVEIQSQTYHSSFLDSAADEVRFQKLREAGVLEILPLPEDVVWHQPGEVVRRVRAGRASVVRQLKLAS